MSKPRYLLPLSHDYKRVARNGNYNATQIANSVKGDQAWEKFSFPKKKQVREDLYGLVLIVIGVILWGLLFAAFTQ